MHSYKCTTKDIQFFTEKQARVDMELGGEVSGWCIASAQFLA